MSRLSNPDSSAVRLAVIAGFTAAAVILPRAMAYATVGMAEEKPLT
jgi:MFS superfamily sulfate permease-like transporter